MAVTTFTGDKFAVLKEVEGGAIVGDNMGHLGFVPQDVLNSDTLDFSWPAPFVGVLPDGINRVRYRHPDGPDDPEAFTEVTAQTYTINGNEVRAAYCSGINMWFVNRPYHRLEDGI